MIDIAHHLKALHRAVARLETTSGEVVSVQIRREYDAAVEDVWDAVTDPARLARWFLPISGDLRPGGSYQLEGNAGGDILTCEPPTTLTVTFGGPASVVAVTLTEDGSDGTVLLLEHTVPIEMAGSGAGALFVGPGWDGTLLALALHLDPADPTDPVTAVESPEGQEFSRRSVQAWADAIRTSGTAGEAEITAAAEASLAQFAPEPT